MTLRPLTCPNCGGTVDRDRLICEYCGTKFDRNCGEIGILKIEHVNSNARIFRSETRIPYEVIALRRDDIVPYAQKKIAEDMVNKLLQGGMIEFTLEEDFRNCMQVLSARLRVLDPHYRF